MCTMKSLCSSDGNKPSTHTRPCAELERRKQEIECGPWRNIICENEKYTKHCSIFFENQDMSKEIDQTQKNKSLYKGEVGRASGNESGIRDN